MARINGSSGSPGNPLALAVLALLWERQMHPYEMSQTLKQRNKTESVRLNFGSLYSVIEVLAKSRMIEAAAVEQDGNRPVRTVYRLTDTGSAKLHGWLGDLLERPVKEYPQFMAALSFLPILDPDEVADRLQRRLNAVRSKVEDLTRSLTTTGMMLPELFSIETEYELALTAAEEKYVTALLDRITTGALKGVAGWRRLHQIIRSTGRRPSDADISAAFEAEGVPLPPLR